MGANIPFLRIASTTLEQIDSDNRLIIIRDEETTIIAHLRGKIQYSKLSEGRT